MENHENHSEVTVRHHKRCGMGFGLLLVAIGTLFLLDHLGVLGEIDVWQFWPMIFVFIGLAKWFSPARHREFLAGAIFILVGGVVQLQVLGLINISWGMIWPVLIILLGVHILFSGFWRRRHKESKIDAPGQLDAFVLFGGKEVTSQSQEFEGGLITAIMGGYQLDLTQAKLKDNKANVQVKVVMGGVELYVPRDWRIKSEVAAIMGAVDDKTRQHAPESPDEDRPTLVISGSVVMGGVEIKN
jgi:predicted membrane protein